MSVIAYPSLLPCFRAQPYSYRQYNSITATEFQSGRTRHRRRFADVPVYFKLSVRMTHGQLSVFDAWRYHKLRDVGWFTADLLTGATELASWTVRFIQVDEERALLPGKKRWELSFVVQAAQQRIMPEAEYDQFASAGSYDFGDRTFGVLKRYP